MTNNDICGCGVDHMAEQAQINDVGTRPKVLSYGYALDQRTNLADDLDDGILLRTGSGDAGMVLLEEALVKLIPIVRAIKETERLAAALLDQELAAARRARRRALDEAKNGGPSAMSILLDFMKEEAKVQRTLRDMDAEMDPLVVDLFKTFTPIIDYYFPEALSTVKS